MTEAVESSFFNGSGDIDSQLSSDESKGKTLESVGKHVPGIFLIGLLMLGPVDFSHYLEPFLWVVCSGDDVAIVAEATRLGTDFDQIWNPLWTDLYRADLDDSIVESSDLRLPRPKDRAMQGLQKWLSKRSL